MNLWLVLVVCVAAIFGATFVLALWVRREMARRLSPPRVLEEAPLLRRDLADTGEVERLCETCSYFDLEEGQAIMRSNPAFRAAAAALPPSEMGRSVDPETQRPIQRDIPAKAAWEEFGVCWKHREGVWGRTDDRRRLKVTLPQILGVTGDVISDCWTNNPETRRNRELEPDDRAQIAQGRQGVPPVHELPDPEGGSYSRDPSTGDLLYTDAQGVVHVASRDVSQGDA